MASTHTEIARLVLRNQTTRSDAAYVISVRANDDGPQWYTVTAHWGPWSAFTKELVQLKHLRSQVKRGATGTIGAQLMVKDLVHDKLRHNYVLDAGASWVASWILTYLWGAGLLADSTLSIRTKPPEAVQGQTEIPQSHDPKTVYQPSTPYSQWLSAVLNRVQSIVALQTGHAHVSEGFVKTVARIIAGRLRLAEAALPPAVQARVVALRDELLASKDPQAFAPERVAHEIVVLLIEGVGPPVAALAPIDPDPTRTPDASGSPQSGPAPSRVKWLEF